MKTPRLWIALTRPDNLVNALAVAAYGRGRFSGCCLVYEASDWWKKARWEDFQGFFDEIHSVEKVPTCRGLRDVRRFYRALKERQRKLAELCIAADDTIFTLAGITALSNALASAYPGVHKILCAPVKKYVDASRAFSFLQYRYTTSGWLQNRLLERRAGLRPTIHLKPWWGGGDGIRLERLEEPLEKVFDAVLLLSNEGNEVPASAGTNVYPAPFPSLHDLRDGLPSGAESERARRKVVFCGTPFLLVRNLPPTVYADRLNACLDYLRKSYAGNCELVYRPHPAETSERLKLRLDGFTIEEDRQVAELYFLSNSRLIEAVYSVSSTVSRVALNYGLNGYALWRCFPFDAPATAYFQSLMGQTPPEFEIRSLVEPPQAYASRLAAAAISPTFFGALDTIFPVGKREIAHDNRVREKPFAASLGSPV